MKNYVVFTVLVLSFIHVAVATSMPFQTQPLAISSDDGVIVMIHPRSDDTHEIETINAVGEGILTVLNNNDEVMNIYNVIAPLKMIIDTREYPSGVYTVILTLDGQDYDTEFVK